MLTLTYNGITYANWETAALAAAGVPQTAIAAALKSSAKAQVEAAADGYRARLARVSAGKLAEYRIKEEIARDPASADADELALLDREAAARGLDRAEMIALISGRARAYRQTALVIGAIEAEASVALGAVSDDAADIEAELAAVLAAAKTEADRAFASAVQLINGGA